jgi:hypothetical protein
MVRHQAVRSCACCIVARITLRMFGRRFTCVAGKRCLPRFPSRSSRIILLKCGGLHFVTCFLAVVFCQSRTKVEMHQVSSREVRWQNRNAFRLQEYRPHCYPERSRATYTVYCLPITRPGDSRRERALGLHHIPGRLFHQFRWIPLVRQQPPVDLLAIRPLQQGTHQTLALGFNDTKEFVKGLFPELKVRRLQVSSKVLLYRLFVTLAPSDTIPNSG